MENEAKPNLHTHEITALNFGRSSFWFLKVLTASRRESRVKMIAFKTAVTIFKYSTVVNVGMQEQEVMNRSWRTIWGMSPNATPNKERVSFHSSNWGLDRVTNLSRRRRRIFWAGFELWVRPIYMMTWKHNLILKCPKTWLQRRYSKNVAGQRTDGSTCMQQKKRKKKREKQR